MKLRCLTSLVATMVMASTAGAAEIYNKDGNTLGMYGSIIGGHYFFKNDSVSKDSDHSSVRFGLVGRTYVTDRIIGFGMWEHEISLKNVEGYSVNNDNRVLLGYAGVKFGDFGSIDYGRNYGILYDVGSFSDVIPTFGGDIFFADNFLSNRGANLVTYRNENFFGFLDGFDFALQYQGKNDVNQSTGYTVKTANGEGYGISASYVFFDGFSASAAYANSKRISDQKNLDDVCCNDNAEAYYVGMKYNAHGVYAAAIYGETYHMTPFGKFDNNPNADNMYGFANKVKNVEVVAQYQFDCGLRPSLTYLHSKASDIDNGYHSYLKKCVTLSTGYIFNNNISTTVDYRFNLLHKNDFINAAQICTDDVIALGVAYVF